MNQPKPFELSIDLAVLDDLGMNLYSNTPAVLSEAVANSYDADADMVRISIDIDGDQITIEDNGSGMSRDDINSHYLKVGYKRRTDPNAPTKTPKWDRLPMGRKGIGKLSLFSLADTIRVETVKDDEKTGCILSAQDIRDHIASDSGTPYAPVEILPDDIELEAGTRITLAKLNKERVRTDRLKIRLARRFSVIGSDSFKVEVDGEEVKASHRLGSIPFLFSLRDSESEELFDSETDTEIFPSPDSPPWDTSWGQPSGWLGVVKERKDLTKPGENLNNLPVLARGRLCIENLLDHLDDGRLITKYMSGQVVADFLDDNDHDDIVTSNRQQVRENDERFIALVGYVRSLITKLDDERNDRLDKETDKEITDHYPRVKKWLDDLKPGTKKEASRMLSRIYRMKEFEGKPQEREQFLRTGIIAFERLRISDRHKELADAIDDPTKLLELLEDLDGLEASLYLDIVKNRIQTIETLENLVDENALEKEIQDYLFKHLWLFDSSWERAPGSGHIEENVAKAFEEIKKKEKEKIRKGRIDIRYRKAVGTHVIIELKRPDRKLEFGEIVTQIDKYREGLEVCLDAVNDPNRSIECVIIGGDAAFVAKERQRLEKINIKPFHYKELLENANRAYDEFYQKRKELDVVSKLFDDEKD